MNKFYQWCFICVVFAASVWGISQLAITKISADAKGELIAFAAQQCDKDGACFSSNAGFVIAAIVLIVLIISGAILLKGSNVYKNANDVISSKLNDATDSQKSLVSSLSSLIFLAFCILCILLVINLFFSMFGLQTQIGVFGDFLGGVLNPIFSFITFVALLITIILQSRELGLTREEVSATKTEIARSAAAQEKSEQALNLQAFETTFFNMLNLHNDIANNIEIETTDLVFTMSYLFADDNKYLTNSNTYKGRRALSLLVDLIHYDDDARLPCNGYKSFAIMQRLRNDIFGQYFRNLFQIIKFVDEYNQDKSITSNAIDKKKYYKLLRAQLSHQELILLFYNCLKSTVDNGEFASYLIKTEMLKHLNVTTLKHIEALDFHNIENNLEVFRLGAMYPIKINQLEEYFVFDKDSFKVTQSAFGHNQQLTTFIENYWRIKHQQNRSI
ncbi:putative phage abortive infection protein [Vibrio scophthalmi]|uniref:putative phage abortive infection protein n=1 Tax=Vibrio scophthalmi TaxID=45658 RepID=UPI003AAE0844